MSRLRMIVWGVTAVLALALSIVAGSRAFGGRANGVGVSEDALPVLFTVQPFTLIDHDGQPFTDRTLRGHPYIASFVFTTCKTICPMITSQQANVARHLADVPAVRFVSVTVDPEHDTPPVLRAYAERHHADLSRWSFLTGEPALVRRTIEGGLLQPVGEREARPDGAYDIVHAGRLLLVDGQGRARGLYTLTTEQLAQLERDARSLLQR